MAQDTDSSFLRAKTPEPTCCSWKSLDMACSNITAVTYAKTSVISEENAKYARCVGLSVAIWQ